MQFLQERDKIVGSFPGVGLAHEMVVIRKDGPGFQSPTVVDGELQQSTLENGQTIRSPEVVLFVVSGRGEEIGSSLAELVGGCVGPR